MATMAVSTVFSSWDLLPASVDVFRSRVHHQCSAKVGILSQGRNFVSATIEDLFENSKRSSIVAEGAERAVSSTTAISTATFSKLSQAVTIEYQRQRAKELQEYFADKKYEEETFKRRIFGWTRKNEITNGRWTMFGIAVGLLTEFATGADFVEQLKIVVSNLGIADVD